MADQWVQWINGLVDSLFGADGLALFNAHPWVYSLAAAGMLTAAGTLGVLWVWMRMRRMGRGMRRALALLGTRKGRRALALARGIREGGSNLRQAIRSEIRSKAERRDLLDLLDRFTRFDLEDVLEQCRVLIAVGDDRREAALRGELERKTRAWAEAPDTAEAPDAAEAPKTAETKGAKKAGAGGIRERLQEDIANLRQRLARVSQANQERERALVGLEEAAAAVRSLEEELAGLKLARSKALPEFRDRLNDVARQLGYLKAAHRELEPPG